MRTAHRSLALLLILACAPLAFTGCAAKAPVLIPGALNSTDQFLYDSLVTVQAALEQVSADIAKYPQYRTQINDARAAYTAAEQAYKTYHAAGAGADAATLQAQVNMLIDSVGKLVAQIKGVKP